MLKYLLSTLMAVLMIHCCGYSQITITANDMPVAGDTFIYSNVSVAGAMINPADSGANMVWSYPLTATTTGMDIYETTTQVSPLLSLSLPAGLYGYKTADSIPFVSLLVPGVTIQNLYTYFEKIDVPSAFVAAAFSASIGTSTLPPIPIGTNYTTPDVWYMFPLTYGNSDSNNYELDINLLTYGTLKEVGYRKTRVDGWGTITTPYYTTPVNCIRVRSEIHEIDSVPVGGSPFAIPRNSVEYKWLVNGDHHPALWVKSNVFGGTETITSIQYRDRVKDTISAVRSVKEDNENVSAYPNPAINGIVTLSLPASWKTFHVDIFNISSQLVLSEDNKYEINMQALSPGNYVARIFCGTKMAFIPLVK